MQNILKRIDLSANTISIVSPAANNKKIDLVIDVQKQREVFRK